MGVDSIIPDREMEVMKISSLIERVNAHLGNDLCCLIYLYHLNAITFFSNLSPDSFLTVAS